MLRHLLASLLLPCSAALAFTPPSGTRTVGGVTLELSTPAIPVPKAGAEPVVLLEVKEGVEASGLHFLHTFEPGQGILNHRLATAQAHRNIELPPVAPTVFTYMIRYADGVSVDFPVRWGESIEDVLRFQTVAPMLWAREHLVLESAGSEGGRHVAYLARWPNVRPGIKITQVSVRPTFDRPIEHGKGWIFAVAADTAPATGRAWVIDPTPVGKDTNPGTYDSPWGNLQHAFDRLEPGDTVYLRGGFYALNRMAAIRNRGGQPGRWLTVSSFPGETPVIDGRGVNYDATLAQYNGKDEPGPPYERDLGIVAALDIPVGYIRIQGLQVQNTLRSGITADGIFFWADRRGKPRPNFVDLSFNTVYRVREMGISVKFWDDVTTNGNRIIRPHSEQMVFHVRGDTRLKVDLPEGAPMNMRHHGQEGLDLTNNTRFEIAFNEVYGGGKEAIDCISVQDGVIHHNLVHSALNGIYIDAWAEPISNLRIYRNFIHNAFAGVPGSTEGSNNLIDFEISENIIIDSHSVGIDLTEATYKAKPAKIYGHKIHNNTIHRSGYHVDSINWMGAGIGVGGFPQNPDVRDIDIFDNIVTDTAHTPLKSSLRELDTRRITFRNNLVWPDVDRLPRHHFTARPDRVWDYVRGTGLVAADPLYVNPEAGDFRLRPGSPAIGAGVNGKDLGALPFGAEWRPGFDFAGRPTAFFRGERNWRPVFLPREKLNTYRNHLQRPRFFQESRYGEDLQQLPAGSQVFGGILWQIEPDGHTDIPSVITLRGRQSEAAETDVRDLTVGRKAGRVAFLHTAYIPGEHRAAARSGLARYVVRYQDGSSEEILIAPGRNIAHWSHDRSPLPEATIAWQIPTQLRRDQIAWSTLFAFEWVNPHPEKEIAAIDFLRVGDPAHGTVALFAISTSDR